MLGLRGVIGKDDNLTGPGDAVDADLPKDAFLRQRHEDIARSDNHVNARKSFHAIRRRCYRLRAADSSSTATYAEFVAHREEIGIVGSARSRRHDHGNLLHVSSLCWAHCHEQRRGIGGRRRAPSHQRGTADTQRKLMAIGNSQDRVAMKQPGLEREDVLGAALIVCKNSGSALLLAPQFRHVHSKRAGIKADAIELFRKLQHRFQARAAHFGTDTLDNPNWRQRLTEDFLVS